jgi:hypothetical protein
MSDPSPAQPPAPEPSWQHSVTARSRNLPDWMQSDLRRREAPRPRLPAWAVDAVLPQEER